MTPDRWARIKDVFQAALDVDEPARSAFVAHACRSDTDLGREVNRLLTQHSEEITRDLPRDLSGQTIAHYKVLHKIGEGGMGVVYKAEDTKLNRTVALKFLRPDAIGDEESKCRLLQEARAAAALDHPNICTVYEIEEADGHTFLAMAYVHGETLNEKVRRRPLALDEALNIAAQAAEGLQAAHEIGIVHRDMKCANLMVTGKGQVKVMDFGLAHLAGGTRLTKTGTIMGTPSYMSPEQVRGEDFDHRTDIWSLGIVLYEAVTGRLPFRGDSSQTLALAIQNQEAEPVTALRAGLPLELDFVLGKALAKERAARYQHADELAVDLRNLSKTAGSGRSRSMQPRSFAARSGEMVTRRKPSLPWSVAVIATVGFAAMAYVHLQERRVSLPVAPSLRRFAVAPEIRVRSEWWGRNVAVSPDGRHIAMASSGADGQLWIQDLGRGEARPLDGTEGAFAPFWSPDSKYIAYKAGNDLMKVRVDGGPATRVCELRWPWFSGGTWSPDGESIVFASDELLEVSSGGGIAKPLRLPDASIERKYYPLFLPAPNNARVLVFSGSRGKQNLYLFDLRRNRLKLLGPGCKAAWSPTGHLLYQPEEFIYELWALPLSLHKLEPDGKPFVIAQRAFEPSAATDGTLVYRAPRRFGNGWFTWVDRRGRQLERFDLAGVSNHYDPTLSPDGKRIAFLGRASLGTELSVWLYDPVLRKSVRLTSDPGRELVPRWSPSGEHVAYASNRTGSFNMYVRRADGSGEVRALTRSGNNFINDWSRDDKYLLYEETVEDRFGDVCFLERSADASRWNAKPWLKTADGERFARLSPDGRFVAYLSNETGQEELYVRPFPRGDKKWTISSGGARQPHWRADGRELFYDSQGAVMAVPVSTQPQFSRGTPVKLFPHAGHFDVTPDGQRFLLAPPEEDALEPMIRVVQNWHAEFHDR